MYHPSNPTISQNIDDFLKINPDFPRANIKVQDEYGKSIPKKDYVTRKVVLTTWFGANWEIRLITAQATSQVGANKRKRERK